MENMERWSYFFEMGVLTSYLYAGKNDSVKCENN
jgi:hypothetical protein